MWEGARGGRGFLPWTRSEWAGGTPTACPNDKGRERESGRGETEAGPGPEVVADGYAVMSATTQERALVKQGDEDGEKNAFRWVSCVVIG